MMKKPKKRPTKIQNSPPKNFPELFGHKTSEPIGFHDNIVIISTN